jgi:hypothetical protein
MRDRVLYGAGIAFLVLQLALVARAQFVESRDFCWAPHTTQVRYTIRTTIGGRPLNAHQIYSRYGIAARGWEAHSYQNLIDLISQCERTYGAGDGAQVELTYSINGREPRQWRWPQR